MGKAFVAMDSGTENSISKAFPAHLRRVGRLRHSFVRAAAGHLHRGAQSSRGLGPAKVALATDKEAKLIGADELAALVLRVNWRSGTSENRNV